MPLREERYTGAKVDAVSENLLSDAEHMDEVRDIAASAFDQILELMPAGFPEQLHASICSASKGRLRLL